jgi:hypothetical protein
MKQQVYLIEGNDLHIALVVKILILSYKNNEHIIKLLVETNYIFSCGFLIFALDLHKTISIEGSKLIKGKIIINYYMDAMC